MEKSTEAIVTAGARTSSLMVAKNQFSENFLESWSPPAALVEFSIGRVPKRESFRTPLM
jgi:hypothetical protein